MIQLERYGFGCFIGVQKLESINYMQATAMRVYFHQHHKLTYATSTSTKKQIQNKDKQKSDDSQTLHTPLTSPRNDILTPPQLPLQQQSHQQHLVSQSKQPNTLFQKSYDTGEQTQRNKMGFNIDWIFPRMRYPSNLWYIASSLAVLAVGLFSKFVLVFMSNTIVHNRERLVQAVANRPPGIPLVTVSNHHSCFDDPGLWGVLPFRYVCNTFKIRWSMAAHDICFTNKYHSLFFMFGKCIPVVRGEGVYQNAVDLCIQKCALGQWVHVFPEGKVNMTKEEMRLKWGVGRIIYESPKIPIIIPMWHEGMDEVLPNIEPYILKWRKNVTLNIGEPIDLNDFIQDLKNRNVPEPDARKLITDRIQTVFHHLRIETEKLHRKRRT